MWISKTVFRSLPQAYCVISPNFSIVDASAGFLSRFQLMRDQLPEVSLSVLAPGKTEELKKNFEKILKTGETIGPTYPLYDRGKKIVGLIHELKARALMDTSDAEDVLNSISDGYFSLDSEFRCQSANSIMLEKTGLCLQSIQGISLSELFPSPDTKSFLRYCKKVVREKRPVFFEAKYEEVLLSVQAYPTLKGGVAIFFRDISSRLKAEQEMQEALDAKDEFLSVASHEFRTPLTALSLRTEMAQRKLLKDGAESFSPAQIERFIHENGRDLKKLLQLVEVLLDISRLRTNRFQMSFGFVDLEQFMADFLERSSLSFPGFSNLVTHDIRVPVLALWDSCRIEQVLTNLLSNAFNYGNGSPIHISASTGGGNVYISVSDKGPGISAADQRRIFKRYERADAKKNNRGLGLGLYICQEIVKLHGGKIKLKSKLGQGSTFELILPVKP